MFPQMALFIAESAYDLFQACAPGGVCSFLSGIAVWTSTLWTRLSLTFLFPPLTKVLIAFHGGKTGDPELFLQGCQFSSCLQKADGICIAQHRRADGRPGEPRPLAQPLKQEGETVLGQRMPPPGS